MPSYKRHLTLGLGLYLLMLCMFLPSSMSLMRKLELAVCTLVGSLFPDIDTKSKIQRLLYMVFFAALLLLACKQQWYTATLLGIAVCVPLLVHHRALFHSVWFLAALCGGIYGMFCWRAPALCSLVAIDLIFFFIGAFSHLWLDGCKMRGFN